MRWFILVPLFLVGCGAVQKIGASFTADLFYRCSKSGVEYVLTEDDLELHVKPDGTPVTCTP